MVLICIAAQFSGFKTYYNFTGKRVVSAFERRINVGIRAEKKVKKDFKTNDINYNSVRKYFIDETSETDLDRSWLKTYKNYRELLIYRKAIDEGIYKNDKLYNSRGFIEEHIMFDSY